MTGLKAGSEGARNHTLRGAARGSSLPRMANELVSLASPVLSAVVGFAIQASAANLFTLLFAVAPPIARLIPQTNDSKAAEELEKQLQDEAVRKTVHKEAMRILEQHYKGKEASPPSVDDVVHGLLQLARARSKAHNDKKRWVLWNAMWNGFKPEFYAEAIRDILWEKVEKLEYPDFQLLKKIAGDKSRSHSIAKHTDDYEFAERLERQGLIYFVGTEDKGGARAVHSRGLADRMMAFALTEYVFPETPRPDPEAEET